jgi:methionyl-tRNA formyltransferase
MKIVFLGTPQFAVPSLECLLKDPDFEVVAVVTQPDKRRGRGGAFVPSAIKQVALNHNLPVWQPQRLKKDAETLFNLQNTDVDVFVVVAYGQILSRSILEMPRLGCINVHGSLLPKYRGAAPIQWSLYHGETETGVTTMLMDEGMDTGAMLLKAHTPIRLLDNADQIAQKLTYQGADLLRQTLLQWQQGEIVPIPQNPAEATYAPLIQKTDYELDWSRSALELHNQVRGFFPNCVTLFRGKPLKIIATVPIGAEYWSQLPSEFQQLEQQWETLSSLTGHPGEVVGQQKQLGPVVQTGRGLLLITEVQLAGKRPQSGWDFVNGVHLSVGEFLT